MGDPIAVGQIPSDGGEDFVLLDAALSIARAIGTLVATDDAEELDRRLAANEATLPGLAQETFLRAALPLNTAAATLSALLRNWVAGGRDAFAPFATGFDPGGPPHVSEVRLFRAAMAATSALAGASSAPTGEQGRGRAATALGELADVLEPEDADRALACSLSAVNLAQGVPVAVILEVTDRALRLTRSAGSRQGVLAVLMRRAPALAAAARDDPALRLDAYDAFEALLRNQGDLGQPLDPVLHWLNDDYLRRLQILAIAGGPKPNQPFPFEPSMLRPLIEPVWELDVEGMNALTVSLQGASFLEDARLELVPPAADVAAEASWTSWSTRHRTFVRAIPQAGSLLREAELDELLLVLGHETTHVFTMFGDLGLVVLALRAALLANEVDLVTIGPPEDYGRFSVQPVTPLRDHQLLALAYTEQGLELSRKLQIVQDAWAGWLEGLAVFSELAADPLDDPEIMSSVTRSMTHLFDSPLDQEAERRGVEPEVAARQLQDEAEQRYSSAIGAVGEHRLSAYLLEHHRKYLPGYLAVRAVVAAWRRSLGDPIAGAVAVRLLLQVTRAGTGPAVPPLDLPLGAFERETHARFDDWLRWLPTISGSDLRRLLDATIFAWSAGRRLVEREFRPASLEGGEELLRRYAEARSALRGEAADAGRVPEADSLTAGVMRTTATSLDAARREPDQLADRWLRSAGSLPLLMPFAETSAPFWLNRPTRHLVMLVRTTERDAETGRSSYQLIFEALAEETFAALERLLTSGVEPRMRVTRFADLIDVYEEDRGRVPGLHYVAYSVGDWSHVVARGMHTGSETVPEDVVQAATERFAETSILTIEAKISDDRGAEPARRTKDWIDVDADWIAADDAFPLQPWARRVAALADEVLAHAESSDDGGSGERMLDFVLGGEPGHDGLSRDGLWFLGSYHPDWLACVVGALHRSARRPGEEPWLDEHADAVSEIIGPLFERTDAGWDVTARRGNGGMA